MAEKKRKKRDPKVGTGKNRKGQVGDYTQMKTLKTQLASSLPPQPMQETQLQKLKKSINHMR